MIATKEQPSYDGARLHINSLRHAVIGAVLAFALVAAAAGPAAALSKDGTSNTIELTVTSAVLDQAHQRVIVTVPTAGDLTVGRHLATVGVVKPQVRWTLQDVMVESIASTSTTSSLALNFTNINIDFTAGGRTCTPGVDACLMENDGIWMPGSEDFWREARVSRFR